MAHRGAAPPPPVSSRPAPSQAAYNAANGGWYEKNFACMSIRGGCIPSTPSNAPTSVSGYYYPATPVSQGVTGVRGFGGDGSGRICYTPDGKRPLFVAGAGLMDPACVDLKQ